MRLQEDIDIVIKHVAKLKAFSKEEEFNMLKGLKTDDYTTKTLDAFVFRFIKLQYHTGQKLFKDFFDRIGEYKDNMGFIDVLDKLEKLDIINSTYEWLEIRNRMSYKYPNELYKIKSEIIMPISNIPKIENVLKNITAYLNQRNLL